MAAKLPPGKAETRVVDASDHSALVAAAESADFVLNALATAWGIPVMEACLDAGRHYLDMGTGGPREITSHDDAWERWGVQGTAWQTGASAACAVRQFARGEITQRGVIAPEQVDPTAFLAEMRSVGLSVGSMDLPLE